MQVFQQRDVAGVTLDHLISGEGYPDATQGKTASEPTVTSFFSGSAEI